jgi:hypothetical protein
MSKPEADKGLFSPLASMLGWRSSAAADPAADESLFSSLASMLGWPSLAAPEPPSAPESRAHQALAALAALLHVPWSPGTTVLLSIYVAVLLTIARLCWKINAHLAAQRLAGEIGAVVESEERHGARDEPSISHVRTNFCELSESLQQATPQQRAEYIELCAKMVRDACDFIDESGGGSRQIKWERKADVEGAKVFLAHVPDNPIVLIKAQLTVRCTSIGLLAQYFHDVSSTDSMRHSIAKLDPMFLDGRVICRLPPHTDSDPGVPARGDSPKAGLSPPGSSKADVATAAALEPIREEVARGAPPVAGREAPIGKAQVEWACFAAPPLAPRDFCWLEHSTYARAPDGKQIFMSLCSSVEREEAPDMWHSHGYVRGALTSTGYIFKATDDPAQWELSYVVQVRARRGAACLPLPPMRFAASPAHACTHTAARDHGCGCARGGVSCVRAVPPEEASLPAAPGVRACWTERARSRAHRRSVPLRCARRSTPPLSAHPLRVPPPALPPVPPFSPFPPRAPSPAYSPRAPRPSDRPQGHRAHVGGQPRGDGPGGECGAHARRSRRALPRRGDDARAGGSCAAGG